jgi:hypothetical protein
MACTIEGLQVKNTYIAIKEETTCYTLETPPVNADFVLLDAGFAFDHGYEEVARDAINGSLDALQTLQGMQTGSLTLTGELRGSGTRKTVPELDTLLRAQFSTATNPLNAADKTVSGNAALLTLNASPVPTDTAFDVDHAHGAAWFKAGDVILIDVSPGGAGTYEQATILTSTFNVDHDEIVLTDALSAVPVAGNALQLISRVIVGSTTAFAVEDAVKIDIDQTGASPTYEYSEVTAVATIGGTDNELYLTPYLSAEPLDANAVQGGVTYKMKDEDQITVSVHIFLDCEDKEGLWYRFWGCRPNMTIQNATTGQIPKVQFTLEFAGWDVVHTGSDFTTLSLAPTPDESEPPICLGAVVSLNADRDALYTQKFEADLGYAITKRMSMVNDSGIRSLHYSARNTTGVFDFDLEDDSQYTAWDARTAAPLLLLLGDTEGNQPLIIVPNMRRNNVQPVDTDGLWTQDVSWHARKEGSLAPLILAFF